MRISDWSSDVCSSDLLGYRGASVQRIASELNVTKGSFYHHLDAKDDLVIACYKRSFATIAEAQRLANERGGPHWRRLSSNIETLLDVQFSDRGLLQRTTALPGLPPGAHTGHEPQREKVGTSVK